MGADLHCRPPEVLSEWPWVQPQVGTAFQPHIFIPRLKRGTAPVMAQIPHWPELGCGRWLPGVLLQSIRAAGPPPRSLRQRPVTTKLSLCCPSQLLGLHPLVPSDTPLQIWLPMRGCRQKTGFWSHILFSTFCCFLVPPSQSWLQ